MARIPTLKQLEGVGMDALTVLDAMENEIKGYLENPTADPNTFPRVKAKLRRMQERREEYTSAISHPQAFSRRMNSHKRI